MTHVVARGGLDAGGRVGEQGTQMLEIHYSQNNGPEKVATYDKPSDFLSVEYLEVPPFADSDRVLRVLLDGEEFPLADRTIGGLFTALSARP
ncbi:hypothetical protein ABLE94_22065 [Gordonia sp. VNK1]|uniref:hypothetical protein n=1 Tax=Gordonia oleivorans TaxID=3156618 RepID=UPI0032B46397